MSDAGTIPPTMIPIGIGDACRAVGLAVAHAESTYAVGPGMSWMVQQHADRWLAYGPGRTFLARGTRREAIEALTGAAR